MATYKEYKGWHVTVRALAHRLPTATGWVTHGWTATKDGRTLAGYGRQRAAFAAIDAA